MREWSGNTPRSIRARLTHPRRAGGQPGAEEAGTPSASPPCLEVGQWLGPPLAPSSEEPASPTFFSGRNGRVYSDLEGHAALFDEAGALLAAQAEAPAHVPRTATEARLLSAKAAPEKHAPAAARGKGPDRRRMHALNQPR